MGRREKIIALNDELRRTFKGGRVEITPAVYRLDPQLRGRAIWAMARYNRFDDSSEHDWGVFIFAGYSFEWYIEYRAAKGTASPPTPPTPKKPSASSRSIWLRTCSRRPPRKLKRRR